MKLRRFIGVTFASLVLLIGSNAFAQDGKDAYIKSCDMCHGSGAAGAPKVGHKNDWKKRLDKGLDVLTENAIKGFRGKRGFMPPKGGYPKLPEEDVKAAVVYMVNASQ